MKHKKANAGASVKPAGKTAKVNMYGGGMAMKKKKPTMAHGGMAHKKKKSSYNMGGMAMKKKKPMGTAKGNMSIKNR